MAQRATSLKRGTLSARWIRSLLGVELGEGMLVGGLTGLYATLMLGVVFVQTIAFALFIREFGAGSLPYAYSSIAALASLVAFGFLRLARRTSFQLSLIAGPEMRWLSAWARACALFAAGRLPEPECLPATRRSPIPHSGPDVRGDGARTTFGGPIRRIDHLGAMHPAARWTSARCM